MRCLKIDFMEPFTKAFKSLKEIINNTNVEVVFDYFDAIVDGIDPDYTRYVLNAYSQGEHPVEKRFDVRINGRYHTCHIDTLDEAFKSVEDEINRNMNIEFIAEKIPNYLQELRKEFVVWNERIIEFEVSIDKKKSWIYIDNELNNAFLKSEGLSLSIATNISDKFLYQKGKIIGFLQGVLNIESEEKQIRVGEEEPEKIGALDIYQSALLFHYLRKHDAIRDHTDESLAKLLCPLTGHSEQNIRTSKGLGVINYIKADKSKNMNFKEIPNYNLNTLRDFLNDIVKDIDDEIVRNSKS